MSVRAELLPLRPTWDADTTWLGYTTDLAAANGVKPGRIFPRWLAYLRGAVPTEGDLTLLEALAGVPRTTQVASTFLGRYPHLERRRLTRRRYLAVACPRCHPGWRVEWHSDLVVVCTDCGALLTTTGSPGAPVDATQELLAQQARVSRLLADTSPAANTRRGLLMAGTRRLAPLLSPQWPQPTDDPFDTAHRDAAITAVASGPSGWRDPTATALLSLLVEPRTGSRRDYDRFFASHDPLRAAQIRGFGVWCPRCRNEARITARDGYECVCENCDLLLTDTFGYTETLVDPVLAAASHSYRQAQASPVRVERQRADRTRLLLQHGRRFLAPTWPPRYPREPAGRRTAALEIRARRQKGFASSRTVIAALLPACWEAAVDPHHAADFAAVGALGRISDWDDCAPQARLTRHALTLPRQRLHATIRELRLMPENIPGMLGHDTAGFLPPDTEHIARWGLARALYLETAEATTGHRPTHLEAAAAAGPLVTIAAAVCARATSTSDGLAYLQQWAERLADQPACDYLTPRAALRALRRVPAALVGSAHIRHGGDSRELAAGWIWLDATGAAPGGPYPQRTATIERLDGQLTPEQRLHLRDYGQALITAADDLVADLTRTRDDVATNRSTQHAP